MSGLTGASALWRVTKVEVIKNIYCARGPQEDQTVMLETKKTVDARFLKLWGRGEGEKAWK